MLIKLERKSVNRKSLLSLDDRDKERILINTKKAWRKLIELHFQAEAGITSNGRRSWQELTDDYLAFKQSANLASGILEASTTSLSERYQNSIHYNTKDFRIYIEFPKLITGPSRKSSHDADAGVHQLGKIKRPLILKSFIDIHKNKIIERIKRKDK